MTVLLCLAVSNLILLIVLIFSIARACQFKQQVAEKDELLDEALELILENDRVQKNGTKNLH